ncbi:MAG: hypothetical protein B6I24_02330 [Bacteroidetes bacterium 4572_128]|nr:MAG: hypothetical protein B6I24_02330 [Bacteroidetes bacterium 4572_128]
MKKIIFILISFFYFSYYLQGQEKITTVLIKTNLGDMKIELYNETPLHKENFIKLVNENFYNELLFHRVIKNFMVQAGDPNSKNAKKGARLGNGGTDYKIPAEFNKKFFHKKGALAAARQGDNINPQKMSSGCQFYIVQGNVYTIEKLKSFEARMKIPFSEEQKKAYTTLGGTPHLDYNYTVFGEVIEGLEIIDKIASSQTDRGNRPLEDIKIISMKILQK